MVNKKEERYGDGYMYGVRVNLRAGNNIEEVTVYYPVLEFAKAREVVDELITLLNSNREFIRLSVPEVPESKKYDRYPPNEIIFKKSKILFIELTKERH